MNFKPFLLFGAAIAAALNTNETNKTVVPLLTSITNHDRNLNAIEVQQINCQTAKEIIVVGDVDLSDDDLKNFLLKLVRSFAVGADRFEILTRPSYLSNGFWCVNIELYSSANSDLNSLVSTIQAMPCDILTPIGIGILFGALSANRRPNIPVEVLILTDWLHQTSGLELFDADRIKDLGDVTFTCAGVGSLVDYGYLGSLCGNKIIKILNYAAIINSVDQIANILCNGIITPTIPAPTTKPTRVPSLAPTPKITPAPTSTSPSANPSMAPTLKPTPPLTFSPSKVPTREPTKRPTKAPVTKYPTRRPTIYPTKAPTKQPTMRPTQAPVTKYPTKGPTVHPTKGPTKQPTNLPTKRPTNNPTVKQTNTPTAKRLRNLVS